MRTQTNGSICQFKREESIVMASKRVVSALNSLTSDELLSCADWEDNASAQEFVSEFFTGGVSGDETSGGSDSEDESSVNGKHP